MVNKAPHSGTILLAARTQFQFVLVYIRVVDTFVGTFHSSAVIDASGHNKGRDTDREQGTTVASTIR